MPTDLIIRPELLSDIATVRAINVAAFLNHPHSRQNEHMCVDALRVDNALEVSLVAEIEGVVVGYIAFTKVTINGQDLDWYGLGPVAVHPAFQNRRVGAKLIVAGLGLLSDRGAAGCVLLGDPSYYQRFGFMARPELTLAGVPAEFFLSRVMGGVLPEGEVGYHAVFASL